MNSTSRFPGKNLSLILCTTAIVDFPFGTLQFSISQNTPIGSVSLSVSLDDVERLVREPEIIKNSISK